MNILWLDLNCSYSHASLALPAIHAQCASLEGLRWDVVRTTTNVAVGAIVADIAERRPDIICATAWLFTHEHLTAVLARVRQLLPEAVIALGGPEFLGDNEAYLRANRHVDMVMRGEGEEAMPRWLAVADDRARWGEVEGACFLTEAGDYVDGGTARVARLDALRDPEESPFFCRDKAFVQLETARGCFNTCGFCVSGEEKPVRTLPLERVAHRLDAYCAMGVTSVRLLDRTFNGNSRRALAMLDLFERYAGRLTFHLELHPALLSEALRERLRRMPAGLLHLEAGIQSLRQAVLTASRRLGSLEASLDGLRFLCSLPNMATHADLIAGLPGYTYAMMVEDVYELAAMRAGEIQLELLKVLPGTMMRREAAALRLAYSPLPPYEVLRSDAMSMADLMRSRLLSRLLDMYYNAPAWHELFGDMLRASIPLTRCDMGSASMCGFLEGFLAWLEPKDILLQPLSLERRGLLLHEFCALRYPQWLTHIGQAWVEAGLPQGKEPARDLRPLRDLPEGLRVVAGEPTREMRFSQLADRVYGFDRAVLRQKPAFVAVITNYKL
jgi:radical SAM superfamily enzyme YgiQ (UPF0313 family)